MKLTRNQNLASNFRLRLSEFSDEELKEIVTISVKRFHDKRHTYSQFKHPLTAIHAELNGYFLCRGYTVEDDERLTKIYNDMATIQA